MPSGERIQFGPNVNFLFETHDLSCASPATISRMGMIFLRYRVSISHSQLYGVTKPKAANQLSLFALGRDLTLSLIHETFVNFNNLHVNLKTFLRIHKYFVNVRCHSKMCLC